MFKLLITLKSGHRLCRIEVETGCPILKFIVMKIELRENILKNILVFVPLIMKR